MTDVLPIPYLRGNEMDCIACGSPLTNKNMKGVSKKRYKSGALPYCLDCQQKRYNEIKDYVESELIALYITCIVFDTPFYMDIGKKMFEDEDLSNAWITYLGLVRDEKKNRTKDGDF